MANGRPDNPSEVTASRIFKDIIEDWRGGKTVVLTGFLDGPFEPTPKNETYSEPPGEYSEVERQEHARFRLYRSLALDDFIEIEWRNIRWIENYTPASGAPGNSSILQRVTMWVDANAKVNLSSFVIGAIAELYMPVEDSVTGLVKAKRQEEILGRGSVFGCSPRPDCTVL